MNKEFLQLTLNRLLEIKNGIKVNRKTGICENLTFCFSKNNLSFSVYMRYWLKEQFQSWPECHVYEDGDKPISYPVGGWDEFFIEQDNNTLWENPKRICLLNFLISQSETQLMEMNKEQHHE